jgi:heptosyltransferase-2
VAFGRFHTNKAGCILVKSTMMRNSAWPESAIPQIIVYAAFKGMGDLLCAAPVIGSELTKGNKVKLLIFPGTPLPNLVELLDFGPHRQNLQLIELPVSSGPTGLLLFLRRMRTFRADLVWISPHASRKASSWKIPLLLWVTKILCWPTAKFAGAADERFSVLFDQRVSANRSLPLGQREWDAYSRLLPSEKKRFSGFTPFIKKVRLQPEVAPSYDLLIAPGANASNRTWPVSHYASLVQMIPVNYRIAVVGITADVEKLRSALPKDREIEFLTGTLEQAICAVARCRVLLTMDSGTMHFANALNVPGVALFGKADPTTIIPADGSVLPVYEKKFPCQPCESATCSQPEVYCMNSLSPETVAAVLLQRLDGAKSTLAVEAAPEKS